jgi:hypothetical protein
MNAFASRLSIGVGMMIDTTRKIFLTPLLAWKLMTVSARKKYREQKYLSGQ